MRLQKRSPQARLSRTAKQAWKTAGKLPSKARWLVGAGACAVAGAVALLGNRRRREAVKGVAAKATGPARRFGRDYDDVTLARKVESELFRPEDTPKGSISVNAHDGTVELRGEVESEEQIEALGQAASKVDGVKDVHNLLHTPGAEPKHSPVSETEEVRARADAD
jgi:osmotically-inducible protein OsmY